MKSQGPGGCAYILQITGLPVVFRNEYHATVSLNLTLVVGMLNDGDRGCFNLPVAERIVQNLPSISKASSPKINRESILVCSEQSWVFTSSLL